MKPCPIGRSSHEAAQGCYHAGCGGKVSVATVSHVVNRSARISPEATLLVNDKIRELGYRPSPSADLDQGNRTIALLVPDIANEFYATVVQGIFDEARKADYAVMVASLRHSHSAEVSGGNAPNAFSRLDRDAAAQTGAALYDCFAKWERMCRAGVDTTNLLCNYLNHPVRELHPMIAHGLPDVILEME